LSASGASDEVQPLRKRGAEPEPRVKHAVELERWIPVTQTAPAAARKMRMSGTRPRPENTSGFYRNGLLRTRLG
jgi:hypothetical protein